MGPEDLHAILEGLAVPSDHPDVLVGLEFGDDAGVYRISNDRALVLTVDIITPLVDDATTYGRIAAANALSDVFAMGGRPLAALNIACFKKGLPPTVYRDVLEGARSMAQEASCVVLGGHTVKDDEIKYGLAVVGEVHPEQVLTNAGAQVGDALVLTKALGTSALATAFKKGTVAEGSDEYEAFVASMTQLNAAAATVAREHDVHALTDVTGFGLSGHALELAEAAGVSLEVEYTALPQLPRAEALLREGFTCGGGRANARRAESAIAFADHLDEAQRFLVHDPQTSGGLLMALPEGRAEEAVSALLDAGCTQSARIGRVVKRQDPLLQVV